MLSVFIPRGIRFINYRVTLGVATCSLLCHDEQKNNDDSAGDNTVDDSDNNTSSVSPAGDAADVDVAAEAEAEALTSCGERMKVECDVGNPLKHGQKINMEFRMDGSEIRNDTEKGDFFISNFTSEFTENQIYSFLFLCNHYAFCPSFPPPLFICSVFQLERDKFQS